MEAERLEAARREAARLEAARLEAARLEAARLEAERLANLKSVQEIVQAIEKDLEQTVISIIRSIVQSENVDLSRPEALVNTIMIQIRPVVQNAVNVALATTKYQNLVSKSTEIVDGINEILRPFVAEALSAQVKELEAQREAARLEAARLEAARREAARKEAAQREAARLEAARKEASRLEAARREAARLEALRQEAARQEAARLEAERLNAEKADLIDRIIGRLESIVTRVIKTAVAQEKGSTYDTNTLTETIIAGLRPVVLGEVTEAIS